MQQDQFNNHTVFHSLKQLKDRVSKEDSKQKIDIDSLNFFSVAFEFIENRLNLTIATLTPEPELAGVSTELVNSFNQLNNFFGNNNTGHITNAISHLNAAITKVRNLPLILAKGNFDFRRILANFEQTIRDKQEELEKLNTSLSSSITSLETKIEEKSTKIDNLTSLLDQKEAEITALNTKFQSEFNTIKTTSELDFEADRKRFEAQIEVEQRKYREEIEQEKKKIIDEWASYQKGLKSEKQELDNESAYIIESLEERLEAARTLVGIIGNVGATGNFQQIADENKKAANRWRLVAIVFMGLLSVLLVITIWNISFDNGSDWKKSLIRIIAAAALSYPATYASRESSKHRKLENYNRRMELELASINPFMAELPPDKQEEITSKMVEKYFGNNNSENDKDNEEELSISAFEKIIKAVSTLLNKK